MSFNFAIQKLSAFGTYGEFSVGAGGVQIRANYLLTKIKPGKQGSWENQLASQMAPWREIFNIDELTFDELIQRDLDDSRVAHDLIPYLLGETGHHARFFPPILAVLVPRKEGASGIAPSYPIPSSIEQQVVFGELFDFEKVVISNQVSPLGVLNYNPQRSAMVIVDGQHRAMAVLALHRQLNQSWGGDPFATYYSHIPVSPQSVAHVELPVCLIYFPDLHEGNEEAKAAGVDLITVCREVFSVVNRQAKVVSKSRELLLDDEDFAAFMMRRTLSKLKDRKFSDYQSARIYSFAFGDSDSDLGAQVASGQLEICTAVAIHKMHAATSFALQNAFDFNKTADVTDGRMVRNTSRPVEVLLGLDNLPPVLGRRSAKTKSPDFVSFVVEKLGDITDAIVLPMFDRLRPFVVHNYAMRVKFDALSDPSNLADPVQSKCRSLMFDGSGTRNVFFEHADRLKRRESDYIDQGQQVPSHVKSQLDYCLAVTKALQAREEDVKLERAFLLFNINKAGFLAREKVVVEHDLRVVRMRAKQIIDTVSTQAFQIGYLMAVLSLVERISQTGISYSDRFDLVRFVSELCLVSLNTMFAVGGTKHVSLSGYISQSRVKAFDPHAEGFRGLLYASGVKELNERQWEFFRYIIIEIVHSKYAFPAVRGVLVECGNADFLKLYHEALPLILSDLESTRYKYYEAVVRAAHNSSDFKREIELIELTAKAAQKSEAEIKDAVSQRIAEKSKEVQAFCSGCLKASIGKIESKAQIISRFHNLTEAGSSESSQADDASSYPLFSDDVEELVVADEILHPASAELDKVDESQSQDGDSFMAD